ncbi:MAG: LacI family transcriptional regulator [Actinomycetota bacterium]|nr:LacI family transcriptional regulator [Actinomycetota bacterium]
MHPTIRDVASRAGVSIATVSRVMRHHDHVREATRDRVAAAILELEFTPSSLGRSLAERRHAANGIVFPDLSGPYYAEVVLGYEAFAAERGRSVLILSTHGRAAASSMVEEMAGRCDGLVIMGRTVSDDVVTRIAARPLPVVLLARPSIEGVDSLEAENTTSAATLTRHLLDSGARQLLFVGDPESSPDVAERFAGTQHECTMTSGVNLRQVKPEGFSEAAGHQVARQQVARELPDAFVCANDELALGVLAELHEQGIDVPGRALVTGWDDVMAARYAGLTTVRQPMRSLGATAAQMLDELITGSRTEPRHEVLPTELVIRTSSGRPGKDIE